jgi:flavin-binding protein dodecin
MSTYLNRFFHIQNKSIMAVLKVLEILSDSTQSWEDATSKGIVKASESVRNIRSAHVLNHSVTVENGKVKTFRVNLKVSFEVE